MIYFLFFLFYISKICNCCKYNDSEYYLTSEGGNHISEWDSYCFQTPYRNGTSDPVYRESYQDMHYIVGYTRLQYSSSYTICNVSIYTRVNPNEINLETTHEILYSFENIEQKINYIIISKEDNPYQNGISVSARIVKKGSNETLYELKLEKEYFIWNVPEVDHDNATLNENAQKGAIVELFGWPYEDIIEESDFLKLAGYLGVKIIPPNEHVMTEAWMESNGLNPWEYFVQPVSYKFKSRFGNKEDVINLVKKCRQKGIRIYSTVVINHMTHQGNDIYNDHYENNCDERNKDWPGKNASAGSPFFTVKGRIDTKLNPYTNKPPIFEYPAVPYCGRDFHCWDYTNTIDKLFNGWIMSQGKPSLQDLNTGSEYVQQRIADFLTEILSVGIT